MSIQGRVGADQDGRGEETKNLPSIVCAERASNCRDHEETGYSGGVFAAADDTVTSSASTTDSDATTTNIQFKSIRA